MRSCRLSAGVRPDAVQAMGPAVATLVAGRAVVRILPVPQTVPSGELRLLLQGRGQLLDSPGQSPLREQ